MGTTWTALAWKEWHECKWKLAALVAIVASVAATPLIEINAFSRDIVSICAGLAIYCAVPLAIFVAAGAASSEATNGTLEFARAQPLPLWKTAIVRFIAGLVTSLAPVLFVLAAIAVIGQLIVASEWSPHMRFTNDFGNRSTNVSPMSWFGLMALMSGTSIASLFTWAVASGSNRKSEVSAGSTALCAIVISWLIAASLLRLFTASPFADVPPSIYQPVLAAAPGGFGFLVVASQNSDVDWRAVIPVVMFVHGLLGSWYVLRFGRESNSRRANAKFETKSVGWLLPPKKSPIAAIAWKQLRESGPIVLAALAAIIGISAIILVIAENGRRHDWEAPNGMEAFVRILTIATVYIGYLVTLVVGIGVFLRDLSPPLNFFWRSRPIDPKHWFWTKVVVGLAILVAAAIPIAALSISVNGISGSDWESFFLVLVPLWTYAAAIMTTCLIRHPIYAAILTWGAMSLCVMLTYSIHRCVEFLSGSLHRSSFTEQEMAATMVISTFPFVWVAWLAVKNDWGWRKN